MNKKLNNTEDEAQIIKKEDLDQHNSRGIYMRDDHCDWGSSGMNDLIKSLDDQITNPLRTNSIFSIFKN